VSFGGTNQANDSALELIEWTLGNKVAHPDEKVLLAVWHRCRSGVS
jgi:hypothetical protein